jgi:hypothetical protein
MLNSFLTTLLTLVITACLAAVVGMQVLECLTLSVFVF